MKNIYLWWRWWLQQQRKRTKKLATDTRSLIFRVLRSSWTVSVKRFFWAAVGSFLSACLPTYLPTRDEQPAAKQQHRWSILLLMLLPVCHCCRLLVLIRPERYMPLDDHVLVVRWCLVLMLWFPCTSQLQVHQSTLSSIQSAIIIVICMWCSKRIEKKRER